MKNNEKNNNEKVKKVLKKKVYIDIKEEEIDSNTLISRLAKDLFRV
jgi:hypothetical protein